MEETARSCSISLSEFEKLLSAVMENLTTDTISSCLSWMFSEGQDIRTDLLLAEFLSFKATNLSTPFTKKLHLIYLVNDVLHHCVRKNNDVMKKALETVAAPMYCSAAKIATGDEMEKLSKLITLWTSKNKFFTEETLDQMKNPGTSLNKFRADLAEKFRGSVQLVENHIRSSFKENKDEHEKFVNHANGLIANKQMELDSIKKQPFISKEKSCKKRLKKPRRTKNQAVQVPENLLGNAYTEEEKRRSILLMYASLKSYRLLKSMNL